MERALAPPGTRELCGRDAWLYGAFIDTKTIGDPWFLRLATVSGAADDVVAGHLFCWSPGSFHTQLAYSDALRRNKTKTFQRSQAAVVLADGSTEQAVFHFQIRSAAYFKKRPQAQTTAEKARPTSIKNSLGDAWSSAVRSSTIQPQVANDTSYLNDTSPVTPPTERWKNNKAVCPPQPNNVTDLQWQREAGDELRAMLAQYRKTPAELCQALDSLILRVGAEQMQRWTDQTKHQHLLVHLLTIKGQAEALRHVVCTYNFDINVQRASDLSTVAHLSKWYRRETVFAALQELGADMNLRNKYGETPNQLEEVMEKMKNIVWLDLELTSLDDPEVMECAVIITDKDLNEIARRSWVLRFSFEEMEKLSQWHKTTFAPRDEGGNGLIIDCALSETTKEDFEAELLSFLRPHCPAGMCSLAGSSVHCDREALKTAHPRLYKFFSHRVIDVSTLMGLLERWAPEKLGELQRYTQSAAYSGKEMTAEELASKKKIEIAQAAAAIAAGRPVVPPSYISDGASPSEAHRAMYDIERSLNALKWLRKNVLQL
eukprot:g7793.t1